MTKRARTATQPVYIQELAVAEESLPPDDSIYTLSPLDPSLDLTSLSTMTERKIQQFLLSYERVITSHKVPKSEWAANMFPNLSERALEIHNTDITSDMLENYSLLCLCSLFRIR